MLLEEQFLNLLPELRIWWAKRLALFQIGKNRKDLVAVLGSKKDDKPILSCYVSKELVDKGSYQANTIIKEIGQYIQGGGGGQAFFATAGGKNPAGLSDALQATKDLI